MFNKRSQNKEKPNRHRKISDTNLPKRSLGQNFFTNQTLAQKIAQFVLDTQHNYIIEIGPGKGAFTYFFEKDNANLVLIEKDDTLAKSLPSYFPKAHIINKDILEINLHETISNLKAENSGKTLKNIISTFVIFGALPYNISKPIIKKCMSELPGTTMFFIIQKEVADKYCDNKESNILNMQSQYFGTFSKIMDIQPGNFMPRPKVISTLIKFSPYNLLCEVKPSTDHDKRMLRNQQNLCELSKVQLSDFHQFEKLLFRAFRSPRKTIKNNLGYDDNKLTKMQNIFTKIINNNIHIGEKNTHKKTLTSKYQAQTYDEKLFVNQANNSEKSENKIQTFNDYRYKSLLIKMLMQNDKKSRNFSEIMKLRPQDVTLLEFLLLSEIAD